MNDAKHSIFRPANSTKDDDNCLYREALDLLAKRQSPDTESTQTSVATIGAGDELDARQKWKYICDLAREILSAAKESGTPPQVMKEGPGVGAIPEITQGTSLKVALVYIASENPKALEMLLDLDRKITAGTALSDVERFDMLRLMDLLTESGDLDDRVSF